MIVAVTSRAGVEVAGRPLVARLPRTLGARRYLAK
jgi:hypothetical protein